MSARNLNIDKMPTVTESLPGRNYFEQLRSESSDLRVGAFRAAAGDRLRYWWCRWNDHLAVD
jgi:hypothetical protein